MRTLALVLLTFCLPFLAVAEPPHPDWANLADMLSGEFTVIGRRPDSRTVYTGHISLHPEGEKLAYTRTINGRTTRGTAHFELVSSENRPALRLRFCESGHRYDGLYEWKGDYDNSFRFTGTILSLDRKTKSYGLEAFFPVE